MKTCRRCHQSKFTDLFPRNRRNHDGIDNMCKACWKADADRRKANREAGPRQSRQRQGTDPRTIFVNKPTSGRNFYAILSGVPQGAERRKRFMQLVKENHPDVGGTHEAMIELNEAWRLLK